jgi:hypothetical protein
MKRINRHTALAPAADTAGMYLVPRHTTSWQRRCYMGGDGRARADRGWLGQALSIFWPAIS